MKVVQIGDCTLVHGDCLAYLPTLAPGSVDAVVTDPPWELSGNAIEIRGTGVAPRRQASKTLTKGAVGQFDTRVIEACQDVCDGVRLGRKFIGVEIDEHYFVIACKRIEKAYADKSNPLFGEVAPKAVQLEMPR